MKKSLKFKKRFCNVGFTLVELVIVIAIVIVLSVVSVPIYRSYVDKAKLSEGYALLGAVLSAQKAYYSEYGNFLSKKDSSGHTSFEQVLGIDARANKYFTYFWIGLNDRAQTYFDAYTLKPKEIDNGKSILGIRYDINGTLEFFEESR